MLQDAHCRICGTLKVKTVRQFSVDKEGYYDKEAGIFDYPGFHDQNEFVKILDVFCPNCFILYKVE